MQSVVNVDSSLTLSINWKLTLLGLVLLPLLVSLGFWQLQRAEQKRLLLEEIASQRALPPVSIETILRSSGRVSHRRVEAVGEFSTRQYFLLDNRVQEGRVGYEVVVPLRLKDEHWLLVNLGWVAAPPLRTQLPGVDLESGPVEVDGVLVEPSLNRLISDAESPLESGWPRRVQQLKIDGLSHQLGHSLLPWVLRISADNRHAKQVEWREINMYPAKHQAYAVQWFAMALALVIALVFANTNLASVLRAKKSN